MGEQKILHLTLHREYFAEMRIPAKADSDSD